MQQEAQLRRVSVCARCVLIKVVRPQGSCPIEDGQEGEDKRSRRGVTYWRCEADESRGLHLFVYKKSKESGKRKSNFKMQTLFVVFNQDGYRKPICIWSALMPIRRDNHRSK